MQRVYRWGGGGGVIRQPGVHRHRFDADPDLDPTFPFDTDPDPSPIPSFTHIGKSEFFWTFIYSSASLNFIFLVR
jgi:hypothetical protein